MASFQWHDTPKQDSDTGANASGGTVWTIITIVLIGVIIGFLFVSRSANTSATPSPAVKAPTQAVPVIPEANIRTIQVSVDNWKFTPNVITIGQNEIVVLELTGINGAHGLAVPGLGINVQILPGQTVTVNVPTDKTGIFDFFCSISCGSGHANMKGQIIIEP